MIALYLFSAIVGVGLLALGALGGDSGADDLDMPDVGDTAGSDSDGSWRNVFSLRSVSYFMAGFGATGSLLTLIDASPLLTFVLAGGMGSFAAAVVLVLFGWVRATEGGFDSSSTAYIGATGRVRVPIHASVPGTVDIEHGGRVLTMRARAHARPESDPSSWTDVIVVDVDAAKGIVLVQPVETFLADADESSLGKLKP